ncbi:hypothetical protein COO60DRAFT_1697200 [Scenedesmus sp. NREL 46B-D3]|nr:hypothetical protein COO60DRAFT_1697200 [Scenedesmus sp. NREL 46B-D3]
MLLQGDAVGLMCRSPAAASPAAHQLRQGDSHHPVLILANMILTDLTEVMDEVGRPREEGEPSPAWGLKELLQLGAEQPLVALCNKAAAAAAGPNQPSMYDPAGILPTSAVQRSGASSAEVVAGVAQKWPVALIDAHLKMLLLPVIGQEVRPGPPLWYMLPYARQAEAARAVERLDTAYCASSSGGYSGAMGVMVKTLTACRPKLQSDAHAASNFQVLECLASSSPDVAWPALQEHVARLGIHNCTSAAVAARAGTSHKGGPAGDTGSSSRICSSSAAAADATAGRSGAAGLTGGWWAAGSRAQRQDLLSGRLPSSSHMQLSCSSRPTHPNSSQRGRKQLPFMTRSNSRSSSSRSCVGLPSNVSAVACGPQQASG